MKSIQKVKLKDNEEIRRLGINCSVLDAPFFKIVWKGGKQDATADDDDDDKDLHDSSRGDLLE